jgi:hypothetical protein
MRKIIVSSMLLLILTIVLTEASVVSATVRTVYPERPLTGMEPPPIPQPEVPGVPVPRSSGRSVIGTVVDSTIYDYQCNGTIGRRIVSLGDSALHVTVMVSPDPGFNQRGMRYIYYFNGIFMNFGYIEGTGIGDQRAGFGAIVGYSGNSGLGNVAVACSHTNIHGQPFGSHWYRKRSDWQHGHDGFDGQYVLRRGPRRHRSDAQELQRLELGPRGAPRHDG